jgi:flagellar hook-length control protein FliK
MNHDFLLKTEAPVVSVKGAKSPVFSNKDNHVESAVAQAFSSELGKQIDKQSPAQEGVESTSVKMDSAESKVSGASTKAEVTLDENGNPLPSEAEIVGEFVAQLLSNFDGSPEFKEELTQIIEQFVNTVLSGKESELDLKDGLTALITQLVKAGIGDSEASESKDIKTATTPNVKDSAVILSAPLVKAGLNQSEAKDIQAVNIINTKDNTGLKEGVPIAVNPVQGVQSSKRTATEVPANAHIESKKTTLVSQVAVAIKNATPKGEQIQIEERESVQSILQKIKAVITKDIVNGTQQKTDKVTLIAELVKKVIPEKAQTISNISSTKTETTVASQLAQLRPDILQALSKKPLGSDKLLGSVVLNQSTAEITTTVSTKTEVVNLDDKRVERIMQLVDLLKPAKPDEQQHRPASFGRAAPVALTSPQPTPLASAPKSELPSLDIQPSLQSKAWSRVLSSRVVWMASEGIQQASLKLNPANLGPVEVRLHVHNEQASVTFIAQSSATRDALEQAFPRLRESFADNGLELTDADVSDQASHQAKEDKAQNNNKDNQNGDVITMTANENGSGKTVTGVEQNNELGVNLYA